MSETRRLTPEREVYIKELLADSWFVDNPNGSDVNETIEEIFAELDAVRAELSELKKCPQEAWECAKEIKQLTAERDQWRWVPEILAGQKFEGAYEAKKYLEAELKGYRERIDKLRMALKVAETYLVGEVAWLPVYQALAN